MGKRMLSEPSRQPGLAVNALRANRRDRRRPAPFGTSMWKDRARPLHDSGFRHRAGLACYFPALGEQDERRDRADGVTGRDRLLGLGIELSQPHSRLKLRSGGREGRGHLPAGPAPGRPEIDKKRNIALSGMGVEVRCGEDYRFRLEEPSMAASALTARRKPTHGYAVGNGASGTNDNPGISGHGCAVARRSTGDAHIVSFHSSALAIPATMAGVHAVDCPDRHGLSPFQASPRRPPGSPTSRTVVDARWRRGTVRALERPVPRTSRAADNPLCP